MSVYGSDGNPSHYLKDNTYFNKTDQTKETRSVIPDNHPTFALTFTYLHPTADVSSALTGGDKGRCIPTKRTPKLPISFLSFPISLPEEGNLRCLHISNGLSDNNFLGCVVADGFVWIPDTDRPETVWMCILAEVTVWVLMYSSIHKPYRVY